jgi:hypothetical protein
VIPSDPTVPTTGVRNLQMLQLFETGGIARLVIQTSKGTRHTTGDTLCRGSCGQKFWLDRSVMLRPAAQDKKAAALRDFNPDSVIRRCGLNVWIAPADSTGQRNTF